MQVSVTIFNTSSLDLRISINSGNPFTLPGVSPAQNWLPTSSASVTWSATGAGPGALGPGSNLLTVVSGSGTPQSVPMNLPGGLPWMSLQIYLFPGLEAVSWMVLNNGELVTASQGSFR